jgi:hypothetical protein
MKHRRGIDLMSDERQLKIDIVGDAGELAWLTLDKLQENHRIGARCPKCRAVRWLDRQKLEKRFSPRAYINQLAGRLACSNCGNREDNKFVIGREAYH